ncbi:TauD/TfdA family dioxygenase [Streptomyces microflavus]|uniref:TauD/TfdA family dioxygenase n=1 Tax=Streptomyces microflavus TaxID=1919 RepID=UPI0036569BCC
MAIAFTEDDLGGNIINLPRRLERSLIEIGGTLPAWDVNGSFLAAHTTEQYHIAMNSVPQFRETRSRLRDVLESEGGGFAVVRLGNVTEALGAGEQFRRLATALLCEVAVPFQPFRRWPLWKEIGTNLNARPGLSTGVGYNAFHIDLVNATLPADYSTLLCVRPDPLGAGASILSNAREAVSRLTPQSRTALADVAFRYGSFFDLSDVGEEYAPFPILDGEPEARGFVRFTAKMLTEAVGLDERHAQAASELADQLVAGQLFYTLRRGDMLIINQHRWVHGREPLGDGQEDVAPEDRRLLLQLFLRSTGAVSAPAAA